MPLSENHVLACIPYYRCRDYIGRAVRSLLGQTHREITVVVINDGDHETPPWGELSLIHDPRLIRFDLDRNRGPYFALQAALTALPAPWLLIQDADDYSHPQRVELLLASALENGACLAVSAQPQISVSGGKDRVIETRWQRLKSPEDDAGSKFVIDTAVSPVFRYRVPHAGLFRTSAIISLGGYYGGFSISTDVLLTNCILMTGGVAHVAQPLYYRQLRADSLTHSPETAPDSAYASKVRTILSAQYTNCYQGYRQYLCGAITARQLTERISSIRKSTIPEAAASALARESARLSAIVKQVL